MTHRRIAACEAAVKLERMGIPFGQDYVFPHPIDTSGCTSFGGVRCGCNLHVTGDNTAHRDRVDPRQDLLGHLDEDVGIPKPIVILGLLGILALAGRLAAPRPRRISPHPYYVSTPARSYWERR